MRYLIVLAFLLAPASGFALDADEMFADPTEEARARDIGRQLRCLKCRNQSIFDSNASIAKDLRVVVRERMGAGDSAAEILNFVHQRFGDYVLLNPKVSGQTVVLWAAPLALLALSGLGMAAYMRGRTRKTANPGLSESERAEARALLDGTEG